MNKSNGITNVFVVIIEGNTFVLSKFGELQMRQEYNAKFDWVILNNN